MDGGWREKGGEGRGGSGEESKGEERERGDTMWGKTKHEMRVKETTA